MPFVDLISKDDFASLWYTTNTLFGNVGGFDPEKPTIIMLHPLFLDSTWLHCQLEDPRLDTEYNIIAFDMRVAGNSRARPSSCQDCWTEAADLAFAHQALQLPPAHVLAIGVISINCALCLASLFPEMCLSLTLCNVSPPTEMKWVFNAYDELLRTWCLAEDLDTFEHTCKEAVAFVAGSNCDSVMQDDLIAYWEMHMPPKSRLRIVELVNVVMNRVPLNKKALASITQPVLIIQGDSNSSCPVQYAEDLAAQFINVKNGAAVYVVKGANESLSFNSATAPFMNQAFAKFLGRLPRSHSRLEPRPISRNKRMKIALENLAFIADDPLIVHRNPASPLSFSCATSEMRESQLDALKFYARDLHKAFSPLGPDGRPTRRYSEGKKHHWFHGDGNGWSYADSEVVTRHRPAILEEDHFNLPLPPSEPVSPETVQDGRLRRASYQYTGVDKFVVKGPISKVMSPAPISRLLS